MTALAVRASMDHHHHKEPDMSDSTNPTPTDEPKADETFTWTDEAPPEPGRSGAASSAASILDSVRDAVDDLAERAAPAVRELSARAAELTAKAADKAAPLVKRAGEVTADASGKLASKSREWASELRASVATTERQTDDAAVRDSAPVAEPVEDPSPPSDQPGAG